MSNSKHSKRVIIEFMAIDWVWLRRMRHRRALFASIWIIAIGVVLLISSAFPYNEFQISWAHMLSLGVQWVGTVIAILGVFALIMTFLSEYLDREKKPSEKERIVKPVETWRFHAWRVAEFKEESWNWMSVSYIPSPNVYDMTVILYQFEISKMKFSRFHAHGHCSNCLRHFCPITCIVWPMTYVPHLTITVNGQRKQELSPTT